MTDDALVLAVTQAQQGDARAFDALVRQFQNPAIAYARTLLFDPAAAEDAAQEAFVQAWRDLPRLSEPAAFRGWLRCIVFKFCDRSRRSARPTLRLDDTLPLPADQEPAFAAERTEEAAQVRAAIDALPGPLAEVTLLYYLTGHDIKEIAASLEVPSSTVKNRLHAARKHLRKELRFMADTVFEENRPQNAAFNEAFAKNVLTRILREFQHQESADPHSADRELLEEGRTLLFQTLGQDAVLDRWTVQDEFLLWRKWDFLALSGLLMRYLNQSLSDSETAWAYVHLANAAAMIGSSAGAVLAHEAFERWMPGKSPILSARWPFFPELDATVDAVYRGEEVRLLFLSQSAEFATSYQAVWRGSDYPAKVEAALSEIAVTKRNRRQRFYVLRMASHACEAADDWEGSRRYIRQMHSLAAEAEEEALKMELRSKAIGHEIRLARHTQNEAAWRAWGAEMTALLVKAEQDGEVLSGWVRGERHDLACQLTQSSQYELVLPLWEANAASGGQLGGWGWLLHAATLWQVTRNREQTLALLREACANDDRDMLPLFASRPVFASRPEFANVQDDAEFRQAVSRKQPF